MPNQPLTREEARARSALLSGIAYQVGLRMGAGGDTFESVSTADFTCAQTGESTFIDLETQGGVRAELNGATVPVENFNGSRLRLDGLQARNRLRVVADCAFQHTGVGLHRFVDPVDGNVYIHSQCEPFDAHRIFACFDQPDLRAAVSLRVNAPGDWTVLANGHETGRDADGWRTYQPTPPIAPYLFAAVLGPFHGVHDRHGSIDLGVWCRQSLAPHLEAEEIIGITRQGFDFYEQLFAHPYAFGKYDQVWVPEFNAGAMENPGCVTFAENLLFRSRVTEASRELRASVILHEMAHMWFGDLVTMRWWDDLWLNESFATYMAALASVRATRFTNAWVTFSNEEKTWALSQDQLPSTHPIAADIVDTDAVRTNFDGITYAKGASVLRQLVAWVGEDAFTEGMRTYFQRHRFGNAELGDFLDVLAEASGRELESWSREWLETAGVATLRPLVQREGRAYTEVAIAQEAPADHPTLRRHRLAVGLYAADNGQLRRRRRVELDVAGARTLVDDLAGEPPADLLLVNDDDLTFAKLRLDPASLDTAVARLRDVDSPLARILCWAAAWDMTRDAETPARRWVELVAEHAASETDIGVVQRLLGQAERAADLYCAPGHAAPARERLARRARHELDSAAPGSDAQLTWMRTLASTAAGDADLDFVRAVLDGTVETPGLAVDTELRWHLLTALSAAGRANAAMIDAETELDPTDIGLRRAATAGAAMPDAGVKQRTWDRLLEDRTLPLATMRALVAGFHRPRQDALLRPFIGRYVDAVPRLWRERSPEECLTLTTGLFPAFLVEEEVVAAADRLLEGELPGPARRVAGEARDQTLRALRARRRDAED